MTGRIAQLSLAALRLAAAGCWTESATVARWLYRFGTLPRGPWIDLDFGPEDDPMAVLGLVKGGRTRRLLETAYEPASLPGWYSFGRSDSPEQIQAACKLYISPRPDALSHAFPILAERLVRAKVRSFKVGRGIEGLLRPDKIIAYFDDRAHLEAVVKVLGRSLHRCPPQGVPFTAEVGGDGLLSMGVDPPLGNGSASWRGWVTQRLAIGLTSPQLAAGEDRVAAALAGLRLAGVDPDRWVPTAEVDWKPTSP